jgi:hypothetical protein
VGGLSRYSGAGKLGAICVAHHCIT